MKPLSLSEALASNRLEEFIEQAERQGVGPISEADFEAALVGLIALPPEDQTSHSPAPDGSHGKQIH